MPRPSISRIIFVTTTLIFLAVFVVNAIWGRGQAIGFFRVAASSDDAPSASPFTVGNLVVTRVGDGIGALSGNAAEISLDEYTTAGTFVQRVGINSTGVSPRLTLTGNSTNEGHLVRSSDGLYLTLAGYDVIDGTAAGTFAVNAVPRVAGRVNNAGVVNLATAFTDGSTGAVGSAATANGSNIWMTNSVAGLRNRSFGSSGLSTQVTASPLDTRVVKVFRGQLFMTSGTTGFTCVSEVGTGTPTGSGNTTTPLPGMTCSSRSPQSFSINSTETIMYVADDGPVARNGGIQKWVFSAGTWSNTYTLLNNGITTTGVSGLTVDWGSSPPIIYATTDLASANTLIRVQDTGAGSTATTLVTAAANTAFRGVDFAPAAASPTPTITPTNTPTNTATITATSTATNTPTPCPIITRTLDVGTGGGDTGSSTSMALVNGNPAIAYYNESDRNLMFARNSAADGSGSWSVIVVDATGYVGISASLAIVNGNPAISYYDETNGDLKYVRAVDADGTNWNTPVTVDSLGDVGTDISLTVVNGNPAISYFDKTNLDLRYVRAADTSGAIWGTPFALDSTGFVGRHTSLAVVNGNPAISYFDDTNGDLKYIGALDPNGTSWSTPEIVDSTNFVGLYTSLAVVNGNPAISYLDLSFSALKFVRAGNASGTSWFLPVTVDDVGYTGFSTSLAVIDGNPAISYFEDNSDELRYIRATNVNGTSWGTVLTLDSTGDVGRDTSLAVVNGNPAISYYDRTNGDLKFVRAVDASGNSWTAGTVADSGELSGEVGSHSSQAIVNGNPAISYYDESNGDLKYVRAIDAGGTNWGTPLILDSTGDVGQYTSLAIVNGRPAISYYDKTNGDLKYIRAANANGTSWGTPVTVDSSSDVGQYTSLAVVNGNPAISYYDVTNGDLRFARSLDVNGILWTSIARDSAGNVGQFTSLAVVDGNPAISYYDNTNDDLKYQRATDVGGTSWNAPLTLDSTGSVGLYTSLEVVNGNPAISYHAVTGGDLKYVRALDAQGTSWDVPLALDTAGTVGNDTSLALVNGNPAISYGNFGDIKYVWATDTSGTNWDTPITLDLGSNSQYQFTSLAVVNGNPAVSYYDAVVGDLRWAIIECVVSTPTNTATSTPTATATATPTPADTPSISGTVTYGNAAAPPKYISNVAITGSGSPNVFTTTAAPGVTAGQYTLTGVGSGAYTVSLSKTTGQNGIGSNDAARIAQHVSSVLPFTNDPQRVSADVSGNGVISSNDAAFIARFVAGLGAPFGNTGQWRFYVSPGPSFPVGSSPTTRNYSSVTSSLTGEDYIGLLIGETTGNWTPSAARPVGSRQMAEGSPNDVDEAQSRVPAGPERGIAVELPGVITEAGKEIVVPVNIHGVADKGVISYEFDLRYDPSVIQPVGDGVDIKDTASRGLSVVTNATEPGLLRVVVYGALPIGQNGVLLNLRFVPAGKPGSVTPLTFERLIFNEGLPITVTDGQVELRSMEN